MKILLIDLLYVVVVGLVGYFAPLPVPEHPLWIALLLGVAAYRGGRAVAYNLIGKPLRTLLGVFEHPDGSRAGMSTYVEGGDENTLGSLVSCPICSGTLVGAVLLLLFAIVPSIGIAYIYVLAAAGVAEFLHWQSQAAEWTGHRQRYETGRLADDAENKNARERAYKAYQEMKEQQREEGKGAFGFFDPTPYQGYIERLDTLEAEHFEQMRRELE